MDEDCVDYADIATPRWQRWTIDLTPSDVDVQSVSSLTIGVDVSGSGGTLYFDDIVLYRAAPAAAEQVYLEAEAAIPLGVSWPSYNDPASSTGGHIGSEDGDGDDFDIAPGVEWTAVYNFDVPVEGVYTVVFRAQDIGDDSFWVRIPGATSQTHEDPDQPGTGWVADDIDGPEGEWQWYKAESNDDGAVVNWTLPAGTHTLEIAKREDGVLLDAILITSDVE